MKYRQMKNIPVVGIGASAGGLKEFERFFKNMPSTKELAFVIIQHLSPNHKSILADIVNRYTEMEVRQIENNMEVKPGAVYIIPPNNHVLLDDNKLILKEVPDQKHVNLPIDVFFRSLKNNNHERAIAVVLSGTGTDGSLGIKEVKEAGGLTIVQQPDTADYEGMPQSAIQTGVIDFIIPVEEMPYAILKYVENNFMENQTIKRDKHSENSIALILELIYDQTGHDFSNYKRATLIRRIERRLTVNKLKKLEEYVSYLKENQQEVTILHKELLISVTNFFRDKETFDYIEKKIVSQIAGNAENNKLRIWVPACATGEEAYSWTLLFKNYIDSNHLNIELQVFASDVDTKAIQVAREGFYTNNIAVDVPKYLLDKYFLKEQGGFRIKKSLRETVIFAEQNLVQDPPFSRLDMISCRNLLIYLDHYLQHKAISIFHYALKPSGYLILGNSESLGNSAQYYEAINRKHKVFRKINNIDIPSHKWSIRAGKQPHKRPSGKPIERPVSEIAKEFILETYTPPSIVINDEGTMLYAQGKTGKFLEISTGYISNNILKTAKEGLKMPLSNAIRKAKKNNSEATNSNVRIKNNDEYEFFDLSVAPLKSDKKDTKLYVVVFNPVKSSKKEVKEPETDNEELATIHELEKELTEKEQYLQNTIEELETANEELKSSNEEAQSTNEELQSTNEELETSKEELQSVNEELTTTNNELNIKVEEIKQANGQLKNLLSATEIATIFLDKDLKIFSFTPAVSMIVELLKTDIGRPIKQFTYNLKYNNLIEDAREVLNTLVPKETEVRNNDNQNFWMRIIPYHTVDEQVEGVVITFTNITEKKKREDELEKYRNHLEELVEEKSREIKESEEKFRNITENIPGLVLRYKMNKDGSNEVLYFSKTGQELYEINPPNDMKDLDMLWERIHPEDLDQFKASMKKSASDLSFWKIEHRIVLSDGKIKWMDARGFPYKDNEDNIIWDAIGIDITERKNTELALAESESRYKSIFYDSSSITMIIDPDNGQIVDANKTACDFYGYSDKEITKMNINQINLLSDKKVETNLKKARKSEQNIFHFRHKLADGTIKDVEVYSGVIHFHSKEYLYSVIHDISDRKKAEKELLKNRNFLKTAQEIALIGTWHNDLKKDAITWTEETYHIFGVESGTPVNNALFFNHVHPDDKEMVDNEFKKAIEQRKGGDFEHRTITNGEEKWIREKFEVIYDNNFNVTHLIGVAQDVTYKKNIENELKKKADELDSLNKEKDQFISVLAHDLKNPFNSLIGFSDILLEEIKLGNMDQVEKLALVFNDTTKKTYDLLTDILFWANPEKNMYDSVPEKFSAQEMLKTELEHLIPMARKKNIQITNQITNDFELFTIPFVPKTVFRNLVSNAIKFTGEGGEIKIDVQHHPDEAVFCISDNGVGIEESEIDKLFKLDSIQSKEGTKKEKGTGFGLKIAQKLLKQVNGDISVESEVGKGSTFYFSIPVAKDTKKELNGLPKENIEAKKIKLLITDDDQSSFEVLKTTLKKKLNINCDIIFASNGQEAVDICRNQQVDLVLMDISMPVMDGLEATAKIKEAKPKLPVIVQSGSFEKDIINKASAMGATEFLQKPIDYEKLRQIIKNIQDPVEF